MMMAFGAAWIIAVALKISRANSAAHARFRRLPVRWPGSARAPAAS
jgi:hypothetical protein